MCDLETEQHHSHRNHWPEAESGMKRGEIWRGTFHHHGGIECSFYFVYADEYFYRGKELGWHRVVGPEALATYYTWGKL
jgi:hypothetical protein